MCILSDMKRRYTYFRNSTQMPQSCYKIYLTLEAIQSTWPLKVKKQFLTYLGGLQKSFRQAIGVPSGTHSQDLRQEVMISLLSVLRTNYSVYIFLYRLNFFLQLCEKVRSSFSGVIRQSGSLVCLLTLSFLSLLTTNPSTALRELRIYWGSLEEGHTDMYIVHHKSC